MPSVELPRPDSEPLPASLPTQQASLPLVNTALPLATPGIVTIGAPVAKASARAPTVVACLQCQLIGRRRMLCSKVDSCAELPHVFELGPILLAGWFFTAVAFIVATW